VFVQIVFLGKLQVSQELWVTSLHAHVPSGRWLLDASPVVLAGLVVGCVILGLGHLVACLVTRVLSEMVSNLAQCFLTAGFKNPII